MMIDSTIATIGRLTKKRAMAYFASPAATGCGGRWRRHRLGAHRHAVAQRLQSFGDDLLARLEALFDHPECVDARSDLDVAERDLAVAADDGDAVETLQFLHRALRHQQRARLGFEQHAAPGRTGRAAGQSGLGKSSCMPSVPVVGVDGALDGPTVPVCGYTVPSASVSSMPDGRAAPCRARAGSRLMTRR